MAFSITNNTPSAGCIQWSNLSIQYKGTLNAIINGYTNYIYAYWTPTSPNNLVVTNTFPTLGVDDCLVFLNKSGIAITVPSSTVLNGDLIVPGSIVANALAANTITGDKIAAGTITSSHIVANTITAADIAVGTISANLLAANCIGATAISANCITGDKIVADAITAREIAAGTITATEIAALTITAAKIVAGTITATEIAASTITAAKIVAGTITATQIASGTITATQIAASTITAAKIAAGTITADKLVIGSGDQGGYLNNPRFSKWSGAYPDGSTAWTAGGGSKVVVDTVNMLQFDCPVLATQYGMTLNNDAFANGIDLDAMQYLCVELRFRITSGTNANGSCILVDIYRQDATYERIQLNCSEAGSALTLNTWYTIRKIFKLSDATISKTFKSISGYLLANWSSGGGGNAIKTIQFASMNMYQATLQDYLAQTWTYPGQVTINGGNIQANTITASQIQANTITASQIQAGTITAAQIAAASITADKISGGSLILGGTTDGNIDVKNSAGATIFNANKNGTFVKDGVMKITSGSITGGIINYPVGKTMENTLLSYGNEIVETTNNGSSQIYVNKAQYQGEHMALIEDNTGNADGTIIQTRVTAHNISTREIHMNGGGSANDRVDDAPWYGIGKGNLPLGGQGTAVQVAGYWGLRLRSAGTTIDLPQSGVPSFNGGCVFNGDITLTNNIIQGGTNQYRWIQHLPQNGAQMTLTRSHNWNATDWNWENCFNFQPYVGGNNPGIQFGGNGPWIKGILDNTQAVQFRNRYDSGYVNCTANSFINASKGEYKEFIRDPEIQNFTEIVMKNNVKQYSYICEIKEIANMDKEAEELGYTLDLDMLAPNEKLGLILEDISEDIRPLLNPQMTDGVDLYGMCSILWKTCQEQQLKINDLIMSVEQIKMTN